MTRTRRPAREEVKCLAVGQSVSIRHLAPMGRWMAMSCHYRYDYDIRLQTASQWVGAPANQGGNSPRKMESWNVVNNVDQDESQSPH